MIAVFLEENQVAADVCSARERARSAYRGSVSIRRYALVSRPARFVAQLAGVYFVYVRFRRRFRCIIAVSAAPDAVLRLHYEIKIGSISVKLYTACRLRKSAGDYVGKNIDEFDCIRLYAAAGYGLVRFVDNSLVWSVCALEFCRVIALRECSAGEGNLYRVA